MSASSILDLLREMFECASIATVMDDRQKLVASSSSSPPLTPYGSSSSFSHTLSMLKTEEAEHRRANSFSPSQNCNSFTSEEEGGIMTNSSYRYTIRLSPDPSMVDHHHHYHRPTLTLRRTQSDI